MPHCGVAAPSQASALWAEVVRAFAINDAGQVAGWSYTAGNAAQHATRWNGATATDLNSFLDANAISAGWELTCAFGINDNGWIVGDAVNNLTKQTHGFLLSVTTPPPPPAPEPNTLVMLLAGLGWVGFTAHRRKSHTT